jgi:hypothetical protein
VPTTQPQLTMTAIPVRFCPLLHLGLSTLDQFLSTLFLQCGRILNWMCKHLFCCHYTECAILGLWLPLCLLHCSRRGHRIRIRMLSITKVLLPHEQKVAGVLFHAMTQIGSAIGLSVSMIVFNFNSVLRAKLCRLGISVDQEGLPGLAEFEQVGADEESPPSPLTSFSRTSSSSQLPPTPKRPKMMTVMPVRQSTRVTKPSSYVCRLAEGEGSADGRGRIGAPTTSDHFRTSTTLPQALCVPHLYHKMLKVVLYEDAVSSFGLCYSTFLYIYLL